VDEEKAVGFTHDDRFASNQQALDMRQSALLAPHSLKGITSMVKRPCPPGFTMDTAFLSLSLLFNGPDGTPVELPFSSTVVAITPLSDETPAPHAPRSRDANSRCNDGRSWSSDNANGTFGSSSSSSASSASGPLCIDNHLMTLGSIAVPF
jgi:hypothetical protein